MKKDDADRVLERLVADARREPLPEVDWDAVETALMPRLAQPPRASEVRRRGVRRPLVFALAAAALAGAAAAAVGVVNRSHVDTPAPVAEAPEAPERAASGGSKRNGNALVVGDVVHAEAEAVVVDHDGQATWTLEPDSVAHVEALGGVIRIALDRGVLAARVVKSPEPESFVVRVEGTRVAVHGTAFRVVRLAHAVRVEVTEGVVGVGPLGGPSFDVRAPSSATTTFEGVRTDLRHAARSPVKASEHAHAGPPAPEELAAAEPPAEASAEPADVPDETGKGAPLFAERAPRESSSVPSVDGVVEAVRRCFRQQTIASGDLHVTVSTQMSLRIQASGHVGEAVFTPPLAPSVRRCVDESVGALEFPASTNGFAVDRTLELGR